MHVDVGKPIEYRSRFCKREHSTVDSDSSALINNITSEIRISVSNYNFYFSRVKFFSKTKSFFRFNPLISYIPQSVKLFIYKSRVHRANLDSGILYFITNVVKSVLKTVILRGET